eukprot:m.92967 g.92967  ORF g.92967 m.92967 type:complete len:63 (+) comp8904_c2_seq2:3669-3857(+)
MQSSDMRNKNLYHMLQLPELRQKVPQTHPSTEIDIGMHEGRNLDRSQGKKKRTPIKPAHQLG